MVNQAFRIKIAYRSKEKEKKIPGIGRYPMGPTTTKFCMIFCNRSQVISWQFFGSNLDVLN